jgi:hypothetical protein
MDFELLPMVFVQRLSRVKIEVRSIDILQLKKYLPTLFFPPLA